MDLRSLSLAVPTKGCGKNGKGCLNNCKFCVSAMDKNVYPDYISNSTLINERDYLNRLNFCLERNFESLVITGTGEPLLNKEFLRRIASWNTQTIKPFRWIEIQTSGITLDEEKLKFLRDIVGVTTISLSLSNIFDSTINAETNQTPENLRFNIDALCGLIKQHGFNLRLSLNMWDCYETILPWGIFHRANGLNANQITFRVLYTSNTPQDIWIKKHKLSSSFYNKLRKYIWDKGTQLETVSFGATRYDVEGISTLVDDDCMRVKPQDTLRSLILRPDCHLYTRWNRSGSILF